MRPSLLMLVASGIGASPPTRTNGRLTANPRSIHVCGRPFVWVEGLALAPYAAHGWERLFDGTGAGNSRGVCGELQVLLVSFLRCRAHSPSLPTPFSGRCSSSRVCRPRQGRSPRYGCRSRARKVSFSLLLCSFVTIPRSRPARALLFPLLLANAAVAGAAGRWLAGHGTPEARALSRYSCRSRAWKVSSFLFSCSFITMPHSRPARALPFPLLLLGLWPWFWPWPWRPRR